MNETISSNAARAATVIIAAVMLGTVVWWLRGILTPFALALFLMVIIDGLARVLEHRIPLFPRRAALPLAMVLTTIVFGLVVYVVAANASAFLGQLVAFAPKLNGLAAKAAGEFGLQAPQTVDELATRLDLAGNLTRVANALKDVASGAVFVIVYLIFLFLSRPAFEQRAHLLFARRESFERAREVFVRIRTGVERYVWVQSLVGAVIAAASYALMAAVKLDNALFWGFLVFTLSYVPILGGAIAIALPAVFALVQFDTQWQAIVLLAGAELIHIIVGNFISPRAQGVSLNVDPVVVVLSLAFWGAIWGVPGMFLSTPLTVVAIIIMIQFPNTRWLAILLSRDGDPGAYSEGSEDPSEPSPS
jgi:AI-2 transport protein TqsA